MTTASRWGAFERELILERFGAARRELPRHEREQIAASLRARDRAIEEHLATRDLEAAAVVDLAAEGWRSA